MRIRPGGMVLLALALVLVACGPGEESTAATETVEQATDNGGEDDGAEETESGDSGTSESTSESGELPESISDDFPVAIPPGWEVDVLGEIGMTNTTGAQLLYSDEDFDSVVAFYDEWTANQPVDYARTDAGDDIVYQAMEEPIVLITVSRNHEERDDVFTYLLIATGDAG